MKLSRSFQIWPEAATLRWVTISRSVETLYVLTFSQIALYLLPCLFLRINKASHDENKSGIPFGGCLVFQCLLNLNAVEISAMSDNSRYQIRKWLPSLRVCW